LTVVVSRAAPRASTDTLEAHGAEVLVASGENETARVRSALHQLGEIDELRLFLAPLVLGGRTARSALEGEGAEVIADAVRALTLEVERVDQDLLISARLTEW
jgi:diaminohydroxyphosphoribosylaminopyrimidine deaminase/5-amino-6-(5-phosphoribosylamino)uracil reductase